MPAINGRIYAQVDDWQLPSRTLRIFVELAAAIPGRQHFYDIDALRLFLASSSAACSIDLVTRGTAVDVRKACAGLSRPIEASETIASQEVAARVEGLLGHCREHLGASYDAILGACAANCDVVVPAVLPTSPTSHVLRRTLRMSVCDWLDAKRECEVFCRGHDAPWSFAVEAWGLPFQGLYSLSEPPRELLALREAAVGKALDGDTLDLLRSLAMNRIPAILFTRDRLLFHLQQQRWALRNGIRKGSPQFHLDYHLNHLYLLLWGGMEHMSWIVNGTLGLGVQDHEHWKVGVAKDAFLGLIRATAPSVHAAFTDEAFVAWRKIIAYARHQAAHRGTTVSSQLYFSDGPAPSTADLDAMVEADPEWRDLVATLGESLAEESRDVFRLRARTSKLREAPERVIKVKIGGDMGLVTPLLNVEHDVHTCLRWIARVSNAVRAHLQGRS